MSDTINLRRSITVAIATKFFRLAVTVLTAPVYIHPMVTFYYA